MNFLPVILCALVLAASNVIESAEDKAKPTAANVTTDKDISAEDTLVGDVTNVTSASEKNKTSSEVEDGERNERNVTVTADNNVSGEDLNDTSSSNQKKRHVYPLPSDPFRHPYIGYGEGSQNIETAPDPNTGNYYPHNRGYADTIPGTEGRDYPILSTVPQTQFSCNNLQPGLYGDVETRCQVWHNCQEDGRKESLLCPNGTLFNQQILVCDWWYNVQCDTTPQFYGVNSQTQQSGQYIGTRYAQGTAYLPPGFGTNKGTGSAGPYPYRPIQPIRPVTYYAPVVTQGAYPAYIPDQGIAQVPVTQAPRVLFQASSEKGVGVGYYAPAITPKPVTYPISVECNQKGRQCGGATYTIKATKGDTGYGVQPVQTGYAPAAGNVKSGYQYSYSNQVVPSTGYQYAYSTGQRSGESSGYQYQSGISTPAMQAVRFEPQYPSGGQTAYQYQNTRQWTGQNPVVQVDYEVPFQVHYPNDQAGFQYSFSTHGTGSRASYQNTFSTQSTGVKSGYQYPQQGTGRRVPGTKSGYQYSYSSAVGGPGSSHEQTFSSGYTGQKSGYQTPVSVPVVVTSRPVVKASYDNAITPVPTVAPYPPPPAPVPVRVTENVKSGYEYSVQAPRVQKPAPTPAPAPVRVTGNLKSGYDYTAQLSKVHKPTPTPTPIPVRVTSNVKSGYEYSVQLPVVQQPVVTPVPARVTGNVKSGYDYSHQVAQSGYGVDPSQDLNTGYYQSVQTSFPRGGGRCASCYGASDSNGNFGGSGRSYGSTTGAARATTVYPTVDEDSAPQIQY